MSANQSLSYNDLVRLPRTMSKKLATNVERATVKIGRVLLANAMAFTKGSNVKDTGLYAKSWKLQEFGKSIKLINTAPYAAIIETGAKFPGKGPPVAALIPWVRRRVAGADSMNPMARRRLAFQIARKIKRDGIQGKFIIRDAIEASQTEITKILEAALAASVK